MARIIHIGNMKGGVGKTTTTVLLATALSQAPFNLRVCVVDADEQQSISDARNIDLMAYGIESEKAPFEVFNYSVSELTQRIQKLNSEYDIIFIDAGGKLDIEQKVSSQQIAPILAISDYLFIPIVAGHVNLAATLKYLEFAKRIESTRASSERKLNILGFVSMCRPRTKQHAQLMDELKNIESIKIMYAALNDYSTFREIETIQSLYTTSSSDPAKINFSNFLNEFFTLIQ